MTALDNICPFGGQCAPPKQENKSIVEDSVCTGNEIPDRTQSSLQRLYDVQELVTKLGKA